MFAFKKKYFLIIENTNDINIRNIKKNNKFVVIYRNNGKEEDINNLINFRKECKLKYIKFYVANNTRLSTLLHSDGIYLSSYNKSFKQLYIKKNNYKIIGSAHNFKELFFKIKQGCELVVLSKLFIVNYDIKSPYMEVIKFNKFTINFKTEIIPLGGINYQNLNKLKTVNCKSFALLSEIKKKPVKIINRLF